MRGQRRYMGGEAAFDGFLVRGKFADASTEADWHCKIDNVDVDLTPYVNPETKEFEYRQKEKPRSLENFFSNNKSIEEIYEINGTDKVESCINIFLSCSSLKAVDLSGMDISYCSRLDNAFRMCNNLADLSSISGWDVRNITSLSYCFQASNYAYMQFDDWDLSNCTNYSGMITDGSFNLHVNGTIRGIKRNISFFYQRVFTADEAMIFINGLEEVETPQTITFSATTKGLLSEEQKQQIAEKGWILA